MERVDTAERDDAEDVCLLKVELMSPSASVLNYSIFIKLILNSHMKYFENYYNQNFQKN